jgi:CHAT domain-containing protein
VLASARLEGEAISGAFATTLLQGADATEKAIVAALPRADIAHLACHGRVDFADPYASFLLTACDARLELSDIVDLELARRPLVYLSACESGLHDIEMADEVQGLSAAVLAAGASEVVGTLWPVFDVAGVLVASRFYDRRLAGDAGVAALRSAQLWLRDSSSAQLAADLQAITWMDPVIRTRIAEAAQTFTFNCASPLAWAAYVYSGA